MDSPDQDDKKGRGKRQHRKHLEGTRDVRRDGVRLQSAQRVHRALALRVNLDLQKVPQLLAVREERNEAVVYVNRKEGLMVTDGSGCAWGER